MPWPLAYHITFGTYGTRLHGDERGTVDRKHNDYDTPILGRADQRHQQERQALKFAPVELTMPQRCAAESVAADVCTRGKWTYHVAAAHTDHVHVLLAAAADGVAVRRWFKAWLGQHLSQRWPLPNKATWWAECGSVKWVWSNDYFQRVYRYIDRQRTLGETGLTESGSQ